MNKAPVLLTDKQMQNFIANGYLVIQLDMDPWMHTVIDQKFNYLADNEPNPGNNIIARLPELNLILDSAQVQGAMISLLGDDYIRIPHCHWHCRKPETMEEHYKDRTYKDIIKRGSHQDGYNPSSTGKVHGAEYLRFMYYSHDVELENGPTHVSPGTQYHHKVEGEDGEREIPVLGKAGTVFISHFDLIHSGSPNLSDRTRNMIKFIFKRNNSSTKPSWNHKNTKWLNQKNGAAYEIENCWKYHWKNLCNIKSLEGENEKVVVFDENKANSIEDTHELVDYIQKIGKEPKAIDFLISKLNTSHQAVRTSSIYALGNIGEKSIKPLMDYLKKAKPLYEEPDRISGRNFPFDDAAHALIACGKLAVDGLEKLISPSQYWSSLNALHVVYSLSLMDDTLEKKILSCLKSKSSLIVSYVALAIGKIDDREMIPVLLKVLDKEYGMETHEENVSKRRSACWPDQWVIHFNAALSLLRLSKYIKPYEDNIEKHLNHPNGQVSMMICEVMKRMNTKSSLNSLVEFYERRRWDDSICVSRTF
jgi:HEAT repeat protein